MGKAIDRVTPRNDPLCAMSHTILRAARNASTDARQYAVLAHLLKDQLNNLEEVEYAKLIDLVARNSKLVTDPEVMQVIDEIFRVQAQTILQDDGLYGFLVGIPVQLISMMPAWFIKLPPSVGERIETALKDADLVDKATNLTFLPRILSATEGAALGLHGARALTRNLSKGDLAAAMQAITRARLNSDLGFPPPEAQFPQDSPSAGLLTFYLTSKTLDPFPIHLQFLDICHSVDHAKRSNIDVGLADAVYAKAISVVRDVLIDAGKSIASILGISALDLSSPPSAWFSSIDNACQCERMGKALLWVNDLVDRVGVSALLRIQADISISNDPRGLSVNFCCPSSSGRDQVHTMFWPALANEEFEPCMGALSEFLRAIKVLPV